MVVSELKVKFIGVSFVILIVAFTMVFCIVKPKMHKPLQFSVIEYFIKINTDGSTTTTKQTTTTDIRGK